MNHDPLCPSLLEKGLPDKFGMMERASCRCKLIDQVRMEEFTHRVVAAESAYDTALRDAVKAVKALPAKDQHIDDNGFISLCFDKGEAVAAIEALGGER